MMPRTLAQEGIPIKILQHSQNTLDQVIRKAKLAVLAHIHLRLARYLNSTIISTPPLACTSYVVYRIHVEEGISITNLQHPQNTQAS